VARGAAARAVEDRAAARGIAHAHRRRLIEAGANERDHARQLRGIEPERWHAGTRHAGGDDAPEILVRRGPAEDAAPQIDARDPVAVAAMTLHALRAVDAVARRDLRLRVLRSVIRLPEHASAADEQ
jgi:hypothetical protein